jgi:hypothetical protein
VSRYFTRPAKGYAPLQAGDAWYSDPLLPSVDVPEHEPSFTGLLDSRGEEIWRAPNPMGFGHHREWG